MFDLRIESSYLETIKSIDLNLWRALSASLEAGKADDVEIILKLTRQHNGWLDNNLEPIRKNMRP